MKHQLTDDLLKQTELLNRNMINLNQVLLQLAKTQEDLGKKIEANGKTFTHLAEDIDTATKSLKEFIKQLGEQAKSINQSQSALQQNKNMLADIQKAYDSLAKSQGASSELVKNLGNDINTLSANIVDQEKAITQSKDAFDYHKATIEAVKSAVDKLKSSNKDLGPVLDDVMQGFNMMKSGLSFVKIGFSGVGDAIKMSGFGLFILVLQSVVEYFTKTTEGAKKLKGGIAAISLVIKTVKETVSNAMAFIGKNIADAVSNPAETVKKIWSAVIENLTNRFKGISVFFKGLFEGNLKTMGDGVIQMGTGITRGIDKLNGAVKSAKDNIKQLGEAVKKTYNDSTNAMDPVSKKVNATKTTNRQTNKKPVKPNTQQYQTNNSISNNANEEKTTNNDLDKSIQDTPASNKTNEPNLEDAIITTQNQGNWQKEFELRQQQLNAERKQAEAAAIERNQSVLKVAMDYDAKQKQLDKAKLDAQFATQQSYLKSVDKLSNAVNSIFGKNTVAAKAAFKAHQAAAAGQVIIDTQKSIMGIWSADATIPFIGVPKAIIETAIVAAAGASSLAAIVKQKPGFAHGGHYHSDGRGALLSGYSRNDDTNAYLRTGEAVVVSEAMRNPWARNLVSAINVAHGGRDFSIANPGKGYAIGGIFTDGGNANRYYNQPVTDAKDLANTLAYQMINNFPPIYVDVKDVNNQQNILAQTVNRVNL